MGNVPKKVVTDMKNNRIILVDVYSGDHGFSSRVDITGENIAYVNLNSQIDLGVYLTKTVQMIRNDLDINSSNCRVRFSFSEASDRDIFTNLMDTLKAEVLNIEGSSKNNFLTLKDFISYSNKPRADYCFIK